MLGKKPVKLDRRTLQLKRLMPNLPAAPPARDWGKNLPNDIDMYMNDVIGDCTCASAAHLVQTWTSCNGPMVSPSGKDVLAMYERQGYDPSNPATDQGAVCLDVLSDWRNVGLGDHKIGAYVKLDHGDKEHVKAAIDYFGGVYIGAQLPLSAQDEVPMWKGIHGHLGHRDTPGTWGGHCMAVCQYDATGVTFLTWGHKQRANWMWWKLYVDEAYAIVSKDFLDGTQHAPNGLPVAELNEYLADLAAH